MTVHLDTSNQAKAAKASSWFNRPDPTPREACFSCGRRVPLVRGHIVCPDCHGRFGPCGRYIDGRYCGFSQGPLEAAGGEPGGGLPAASSDPGPVAA